MSKFAPPATSALSALRWKSFVRDATPRLVAILGPNVAPRTPSRSLAQIRQDSFFESWFTSAPPALSPADQLLGSGGPNNDHKPPDERTLKLGKTLRTLSPLLPDILTTPLPQDILSRDVVLHLFPSTHPYLPSVRGRVAYRAALWTSPVAWGTVPMIGNVKLRILSEKMVRTGLAMTAEEEDRTGEEKLVVRWKTESNRDAPSTAQSTTAAGSSSISSSSNIHGGTNKGLSKLLGGDKPLFSLSKDDEFTGLFIFGFDEDGKVASLTIEHADEGDGDQRTSRVVTLTDWLLGLARGRGEKGGDMVPGLAAEGMRGLRLCREAVGDGRRRL